MPILNMKSIIEKECIPHNARYLFSQLSEYLTFVFDHLLMMDICFSCGKLKTNKNWFDLFSIWYQNKIKKTYCDPLSPNVIRNYRSIRCRIKTMYSCIGLIQLLLASHNPEEKREKKKINENKIKNTINSKKILYNEITICQLS